MGAITRQPESFVDCVAMLERQNRAFRRIGLMLFLVCFVAIGLIAWQLRKLSASVPLRGPNKIVVANQFNLVDSDGKMQGMLTGTPGGAIVFLNGPENKVGLMFGPGPDKFKGSSLSLMSANGEQQVSLNSSDSFSWMTVGTKESTGEKVELAAGDGIQHVTVSDKAGF